jgi:hypothetical protein
MEKQGDGRCGRARCVLGGIEPDPETDEVVGYIASEELRAAMEQTAAMN